MNETVHISGTDYDLIHRVVSHSVEQTVRYSGMGDHAAGR